MFDEDPAEEFSVEVPDANVQILTVPKNIPLNNSPERFWLKKRMASSENLVKAKKFIGNYDSTPKPQNRLTFDNSSSITHLRQKSR